MTKLTAALKLNPIVLKKAKIASNFGLSDCNRVKKNVSSKLHLENSNYRTNSKDSDDKALHLELCCLQTQLFSFLVV